MWLSANLVIYLCLLGFGGLRLRCPCGLVNSVVIIRVTSFGVFCFRGLMVVVYGCLRWSVCFWSGLW